MDAHRVLWNPRLEIIKKTIANEKNHVISFDIFDTLFVRNTLHPEDILEIISYEKPLLNEYNFKEYRQIAEEICRKNINSTNPSWQDVNLTEIYDSLQELLKIDDATKVDLMQTEIETESKFLMVRGIGKELFELALYLEKEIILISDMYLEENTVLHILSNAGFSGINKLYLSSRYRALKATGRLYEIVRADYPDKQIVHIGDNWNSDFIIPQQYGIQSFFLPKNSDILFNRLGDSYTGNSIGNAVRNQNSIIDLSQHLKKLPVRCLYASVANLMFDNPFASSAEEGDYNMDPYFIGVNALGMYEFGISLWICKQMKAENRKRILFTARDGYYIKIIFDYINEKWYNRQFESDYIFVSRRSLIPIRICTPRDVLSIRNRTNWKNQSSKSILKIYQEIFVDYETIGKQIIIQEGFSLENRFQSEMEFVSFLKMASEKLFDVEKAQKARNICEKYLKGHISKGDVIFDLGYSGKMHADIVAAIGFSVDGYYVNSSGFDAMYRAKDNRFNIQCYYDFIPTMSGVINEFIMSDTNSSCIGYHDCIDGQPEPVFENTVINGVNRYVVEEIQRGAFDFARYNVDHYHEYQKYMLFQGIDMGVQYEKFLMHMQEYDRKLFDCCTIEDQYYGGVIQNPLLDVWGWQVKDRQLYNVIVEDVTIQKSLYIARGMTADAELSPDSRWYISDVSLAWQLYHDKGMEKKGKIQKILFWLVNDRAYLKRRFKEKYRFGRN